MIEQVLESVRKATESAIQAQQKLFRKWVGYWTRLLPSSGGAKEAMMHSASSAKKAGPWTQTSFLRYFLVLLIPAAACLYMKYQLLGGGAKFQRLSPSEQLSFYRGDLLWESIIGPLCALVVTGILPRRFRAPFLGALVALVLLFLMVEQRTYWLLQRFLSQELVVDAICFGTQNQEVTRDYLDTFFLCKGLVLLGGVVVLAAWAGYRDYRQSPLPRWSVLVGSLLGVGLLTVTGWSWLPWMKSSVYHRPISWLLAHALWEGEEGEQSEFTGLSPEELVARYREMTGAPARQNHPDYWGKARDCDVLLFVLETTPAKCLPFDGDLKDCPNLARLRKRAWVPRRHYSTYPWTSRAVFSILTSWYPSNRPVGFSTQYSHRLLPGVMRSLKEQGYCTAAYAPDTFTRKVDGALYRQAGIDHSFYSDQVSSPGEITDSLDLKIRLDRIALQALKEDMAHWHKANQRFAAIYLPQIAHGPWPDITRGRLLKSDMPARSRALTALQDGWLGEILDQLERAGRLDKTLVVVTGDHGVRTPVEDPHFRGGKIDDYSFHVPLLLYAPPALSGRADISWMTSHIDIGPSLLDLLGVSSNREFEQGSPMWDKRLSSRTVYFWAGTYLGADGYYQPGKQCAMWNHLSDAVYLSDRLRFENSVLQEPDSPSYATVTRDLSRMAGLQEAWAKLPEPTSSTKPD